MIINLDKYIEEMYVYIDDDNKYVAYSDNPKDIQEKLKEIDKEHFDIFETHLITFEND